VKDTASSPRVKSEARVVPMRRAAWDGGRLGFTLTMTTFPSTKAATRRQDGSGGAQHPAYIALGWLQVRKEEIGRRIRSVMILESTDLTA
jgi:hypothetical protein